MTTRICLIGLPRSGSQYVSELIARSIGSGMKNLAEPFTVGHPYCIEQYDNRLLRAIPSDFTKYDSHEVQIDYVLNLLKTGNQDQSLVIKLFLTEDNIPFTTKILNELHALNFKFLIIKRENIENHLVSYVFGLSTNKWNSLHGTHDNPIHIPTKLFPNMSWLYNRIINFDKLIMEYKLDTTFTVRYERAVYDLTRYFLIPIITNIRLEKQLPDNPYEMIENAKEVQDYINILISKQPT